MDTNNRDIATMETTAVAVEELKEIDEISLSLSRANSASSRPTNMILPSLTDKIPTRTE